MAAAIEEDASTMMRLVQERTAAEAKIRQAQMRTLLRAATVSACTETAKEFLRLAERLTNVEQKLEVSCMSSLNALEIVLTTHRRWTNPMIAALTLPIQMKTPTRQLYVHQ